MKNGIILLSFALMFLSACNTEQTPSSGNEKELEEKIAALQKENEEKDALINESLEFFSEIQNNLESIELKKDEIRIRSTDKELSAEDKEWILEQINHINYLRQENLKKIDALNKKIRSKDLKIKELDKMIQDLAQNIRDKDDQITILQADLSSLDKAYSKLFDAYQEKAELVEELTEELNTVYYTYGTEDELVKNQVIERKNGFIGIGKKINLVDNFNEKYFARIDLSEEKEIFVEGSDIKIITDHPSRSYTLVPSGKNTKIRINQPREFWKVSNYLVVVVE
jgi:DNA repair exonuclease SbcCD ATPase subunit